MRTSRILIGLAALALVAAGCGDDDGDGDAAPVATETGDDATVAVADTDLGSVLADGAGMTLYLFTNDEGGTSTCYDDCAQAWPPLTVDGDPVAGDGVDTDLLGTVERDDGKTQVTYASMPLYYYAPDSAPGDTTGQGVGGVWFAVTPDGSAVQADDAPSPESSLGGY